MTIRHPVHLCKAYTCILLLYTYTCILSCSTTAVCVCLCDCVIVCVCVCVCVHTFAFSLAYFCRHAEVCRHVEVLDSIHLSMSVPYTFVDMHFCRQAPLHASAWLALQHTPLHVVYAVERAGVSVERESLYNVTVKRESL